MLYIFAVIIVGVTLSISLVLYVSLYTHTCFNCSI